MSPIKISLYRTGVKILFPFQPFTAVTAGISCWDHRSQVKNIEETSTVCLNLVAPLFGLTICRTGKRCFLNVVFLGSVIPGPNPHCAICAWGNCQILDLPYMVSPLELTFCHHMAGVSVPIRILIVRLGVESPHCKLGAFVHKHSLGQDVELGRTTILVIQRRTRKASRSQV